MILFAAYRHHSIVYKYCGPFCTAWHHEEWESIQIVSALHFLLSVACHHLATAEYDTYHSFE